MATRIAVVCRQQKVGEVVMGRAGGQPQTAHVPMVPPSLVCRLQSYEQGRSPYSGLAAAGVLGLVRPGRMSRRRFHGCAALVLQERQNKDPHNVRDAQ
jgi:hypothetical protein